jgi:YbgC/YbaW family acyl-CoA thioester hydrolase
MNKKYSIFSTEIKVRPDDIDMNNHVHSSKYMDYVLAARYEQMGKDYGMPMDEFIKLGYIWVISSIQINFIRPLKLGDEMVVQTQLSSFGGAQSEVNFNIKKKGTMKTSADGKILYTMISAANGKPVRIPDEIINKYAI